jgi:hypothetical protein
MAPRRTVVVDMATTGFNPYAHVPVEIAWLVDGDVDPVVFIPPHQQDDIERAQEGTLQRIDYYGNFLGRRLDIQGNWDNGGVKLGELHEVLDRQSFVSWNCFADATMLNSLFAKFELAVSPWHKIVDLASYAGGCLGRSPNDLPSFEDTCELLRVEPRRNFTAKGDVIATYKCLEMLRRRPGKRRDAYHLACLQRCRGLKLPG